VAPLAGILSILSTPHMKADGQTVACSRVEVHHPALLVQSLRRILQQWGGRLREKPGRPSEPAKRLTEDHLETATQVLYVKIMSVI
jgi:hypothetical protein